MKIKDLFEPFILHSSKIKSPRTIEHYRAVESEILRKLGDYHIENLRINDCDDIRPNLKLRGKTIEKRGIITLRKLLEYARNQGYRIPVDWRDIAVPKDAYNEPRALKEEEIAIIRRALVNRTNNKKQRYAAIRMIVLFELILRTGLRPSEALSLQWSSVDLFAEEITFMNCKSKDIERTDCVGITEWLKLLKKECRPADVDSVFVSDSNFGAGIQPKQVCYETVKTYVRGLQKQTGIEHFSLYILRKTYITGLLELGFNIREVQKLGRHKSVSTTLMYYAAVERSAARRKNRTAMENAWKFSIPIAI